VTAVSGPERPKLPQLGKSPGCLDESEDTPAIFGDRVHLAAIWIVVKYGTIRRENEYAPQIGVDRDTASSSSGFSCLRWRGSNDSLLAEPPDGLGQLGMGSGTHGSRVDDTLEVSFRGMVQGHTSLSAARRTTNPNLLNCRAPGTAMQS
jgi:hypothetical protein